MEAGYHRITVHPYVTLINGVTKYIQSGGKLTAKQNSIMAEYVREAREIFKKNPFVTETIVKYDAI
jgi:hypothetical protein